MKNKINRLGLQFFAESDGNENNDIDNNNEDIDFSVVFGNNEDNDAGADASNNSENDDVDTNNEDSEGENDADKAGQQSSDDIPNEVWKKARTKAEKEAQIKIENAKKEFMNTLADDDYIGKIDPYSGKIVKTKEDQQKYLESLANDSLKNAGLPEDTLKKLIESNPIIKQAELVTKQAQRERGQIQLNEQIKEISKLDPEIKTLEDIMKLPNRDKIDELVINNGYSLVDAYKVVNFDKLIENKATVVKQQTINSVKGKSHLTPAAGTGGDDVQVPRDVYQMYKDLNPNVTDEEIRKHYAKNRKKER